MSASETEQRAAGYARQAAEVASKLKPGTWEAVQAMATLSIAESLIAQVSGGKPSS